MEHWHTSSQVKRATQAGRPRLPYLFVLVVEYLHRSLKQLRHVPHFNYHHTLKLVHVCLADDWSCFVEQTRFLSTNDAGFEHFSTASGLQANLDKSFFYVVETSSFKEQILHDIKYTLGEIPFKYLGVSLSSKLTIQQCLPQVGKDHCQN